VIGVLEVEQKEKGKPWQRNDRYFAVAAHSHSQRAVKRLADLPAQLEVEAFFVYYAGRNGKELRVVRRRGPKRAHKLLKVGVKAFKAGK
jgi:inorganic pyrophosphatase